MNVDGGQKLVHYGYGNIVCTSETSCQYSTEISSIHFSGGCEKQEDKSPRQK